MPLISSIEINTNCLFFFYFFIGCYIICVSFLIYTLIRLLKYYLRQKHLNTITNDLIDQDFSTGTTILVKIHNLTEQDTMLIKNELDILQPLIIKTQDLMLENNFNEPPPMYKEHL